MAGANDGNEVREIWLRDIRYPLLWRRILCGTIRRLSATAFGEHQQAARQEGCENRREPRRNTRRSGKAQPLFGKDVRRFDRA